jgi:hypothetical protein
MAKDALSVILEKKSNIKKIKNAERKLIEYCTSRGFKVSV